MRVAHLPFEMATGYRSLASISWQPTPPTLGTLPVLMNEPLDAM